MPLDKFQPLKRTAEFTISIKKLVMSLSLPPFDKIGAFVENNSIHLMQARKAKITGIYATSDKTKSSLSFEADFDESRCLLAGYLPLYARRLYQNYFSIYRAYSKSGHPIEIPEASRRSDYMNGSLFFKDLILDLPETLYGNRVGSAAIMPLLEIDFLSDADGIDLEISANPLKIYRNNDLIVLSGIYL
jgi:hypothetical protein